MEIENTIYKSVAAYAQEEGVSTSRIFAMIKKLKYKDLWEDRFSCKLPGSKTIYLTQEGQDFLDKERGKYLVAQNTNTEQENLDSDLLTILCEQQQEIIRNQKLLEEMLKKQLECSSSCLPPKKPLQPFVRLIKFRHRSMVATVLKS